MVNIFPLNVVSLHLLGENNADDLNFLLLVAK
jgi:hypothetical protein